jgi:hypothetical protein
MLAGKMIRKAAGDGMTTELIGRPRGARRAFVDTGTIVAAAALLLSLVVAFTAVSIGIARADTLAPLVDLGGGRAAFVGAVGCMIAGVGSLAAAFVRGDAPQRRGGSGW